MSIIFHDYSEYYATHRAILRSQDHLGIVSDTFVDVNEQLTFKFMNASSFSFLSGLTSINLKQDGIQNLICLPSTLRKR